MRLVLSFVNRSGFEVAVAYFRAGYTPKDYPTDAVSRLWQDMHCRYSVTRTALELTLGDRKSFFHTSHCYLSIKA